MAFPYFLSFLLYSFLSLNLYIFPILIPSVPKSSPTFHHYPSNPFHFSTLQCCSPLLIARAICRTQLQSNGPLIEFHKPKAERIGLNAAVQPMRFGHRGISYCRTCDGWTNNRWMEAQSNYQPEADEVTAMLCQVHLPLACCSCRQAMHPPSIQWTVLSAAGAASVRRLRNSITNPVAAAAAMPHISIIMQYTLSIIH